MLPKFLVLSFVYYVCLPVGFLSASMSVQNTCKLELLTGVVSLSGLLFFFSYTPLLCLYIYFLCLLNF